MGGLTEWIFGKTLATDGFPEGADAIGGGPTSNFWYSIFRSPTKSGVDVNPDVAMNYAAVWCATLRRVGVMSMLPKNLYRRDGKNRVVASDRPEHWLLHSDPNPEMTGSMYHSLMEEWRLNGGNAYAEIEWDVSRTSKQAVALHPIHPQYCKSVRDEKRNLWYQVKSPGMDEPEYIEPADVIHLPSLMTRDGFNGMGVLEQARESIGFGIATERHGASAFGNGGMPRVVVKAPEGRQPMSPTSRSEFRKDWRQLHGNGEENVAILDGGFDVFPLTLSNEDMQFLSTRQHNTEEMARWYDLPPHMLHHLIRMTNNNIEHQGIEAVLYSFMPWIVPNEQEYLRKLIPDVNERRQYYFKYEVNALMRGDSAARSAFYNTMITLGVWSPNDVCELEDWNPFTGGDGHYIQGAMARIKEDGSLEMASKAESASQPEPPDDPADDTDAEDDTDDTREQLRSTARAMLKASFSRLVAREAMKVRKAAESPKAFVFAIDKFYAEHKSTMALELEPVLLACASFGVTGTAADWSSTLCQQSKSRLLELAGNVSAAELSGSVNSLLAEWEASRAESIVSAIAELN